ncbi:hypothetical protein TrLO_g8138 [Triparma laevis f. longispina]|uniref:Uncharacterized protein n=1 Tax=Triparma laevis f. longispina TaxID=1714387 RepID=A0A9W7F5C2_9STRA|nr:hypothetical protein TrLO_g8138 [Triparma laevis f. longispina]
MGKYLQSATASSEADAYSACSEGKTNFAPGATSSSSCVLYAHVLDFRGCTDGTPVVDGAPGSALAATAKNGPSCSAEGMAFDGVDDWIYLDGGKWGGTMSIDVYVDTSSLCLIFQAGKFDADNAVDPAAHAACTWCPPGKNNEDDGADRFLHNGEDDCLLCTPWRYSSNPDGAALRDECPEGMLSGSGSSGCGNCPPGYSCSGGGAAPCSDGSEAEQKCVCMTSFTRVGGDGDDSICTCKPGFTLTGETCSACEIGRFKDDNGVHSCSRCEDVLKCSVATPKNSTDASANACPAGKSYDNSLMDNVITVSILFAGAVFFVGLLVLFKKMTNVKKGLGKRLKNGRKIIFVAAQIMANLPSIISAMSMPPNVKEAMRAASFFNVEVFNMGFRGDVVVEREEKKGTKEA